MQQTIYTRRSFKGLEWKQYAYTIPIPDDFSEWFRMSLVIAKDPEI